MTISRRSFVEKTIAGGLGLGLAPALSTASFGQDAMMKAQGKVMSDMGDISIYPVNHASLALTLGDTVIYADPVGEASRYEGLPPASLILVTHEHGDHYNADTLGALMGPDTVMVANPAVHGMLPDSLAQATAIANGETTEAAGVSIEAIPAYNLTEDRKRYHPEGRDNGYVLNLGGARVYIAGDTEDIPEMRALEGIDLAFVPMNLPFTMDIEQAASAVIEFAPKVIYPYHYGESDTAAFKQMVEDGGGTSEVRLHDWYA